MNILFYKKKIYIFTLKWKAYLTTNDREKFGLTVKLLIGQMLIFMFLTTGYTMQVVYLKGREFMKEKYLN
jgi:hypothetical protein